MQDILSAFGHTQIATIPICVSILSLFFKQIWPSSTSNDRINHSFAGGRMQKWHIWEETDSCQNLQIQVVNVEAAYESTPSSAMQWITASVRVEMCVCEAECRSRKA